jgi:hypothetical protein
MEILDKSKRLRMPPLAMIFCLLTVEAQGAPVTLKLPTASFSQAGFPVGNALDPNPKNGWAISDQFVHQTAVFQTSADLFPRGGTLTFTLDQLFGLQNTIRKFRLSVTTASRSQFADGRPSNGNLGTGIWRDVDLLVSLSSANGTTLTKLSDKSILASGSSPETDTYTVKAYTSLSGITGVRLDVLQDDATMKPPGRSSNGNFVLTHLAVDAVGSQTALGKWWSAFALLISIGLILFWIGRRRRRLAAI